MDDGAWIPPWTDDAWENRFGEAWRRLLVRIAVAGKIISSSSIVQDAEEGRLWQDVIEVASQSAYVARIVFEGRMQVEVRGDALAIAREDARNRLDALAREYGAAREGMKPGPERTRAMDEIVGRARSLARGAQFDTRELVAKLQSENAGERVVALAMIQATGDHGTFDTVAEAARMAYTPFEQYHAFQALESLRPSLSDQERARLVSVLEDPEVIKEIGTDSSRARLRARLLEGISSDMAQPVARVAAARPHHAAAALGA
jgi:hypothetical protein